MAKKEAVLEPKVEVKAEVREVKEVKEVSPLLERVKILTEDLDEIRQDFGRLAALLGESFGEPMKTRASEIVLRHLGKGLKDSKDLAK